MKIFTLLLLNCHVYLFSLPSNDNLFNRANIYVGVFLFNTFVLDRQNKLVLSFVLQKEKIFIFSFSFIQLKAIRIRQLFTIKRKQLIVQIMMQQCI